MAKKLTQKRKTGDLGEDIAERFLMKRGFKVIERNYLRKWGEIDIIATKKRKYYFVEVKTVSCENIETVTHETSQESKNLSPNSVSHETFQESNRRVEKDVSHETSYIRPEDNLHSRKLQRLGRAIQSYLLEKNLEDVVWQLDAAIVYLDVSSREARIKMIENIII